MAMEKLTKEVETLVENAVEWCRMQGIVFDAVNAPLPEQIQRWNNDTRKIYADYYIDDKAMTVSQAENIMDAIITIARDCANSEKGGKGNE